MYFLIVKINNFRGDLSDVSAETVTLVRMQALRTLETFRDCDTDEQFESINTLKATMLSNLAGAYIQTRDYTLAVAKCDAALSLNEDNMKVVLRKAKALSMNGDFDKCRECCDQARFRNSTSGLVVKIKFNVFKIL